MWRGGGGEGEVVRWANRRESRYYCLSCIHCCSIVLGGVVLSVVVNRNWVVASDWLAGGGWYVKCELKSG
jgi:hypothetical protein